MKNLSRLFSEKEIEDLASNCWVTDEDLQYFDYKRFAKALIFVMANKLNL